MKVTFVSNYINHHQIPLSNVLYEHLGEEYTFIQTEPMEEERIKLGWNPTDVPVYVKYAYEEPQVCKQLVMESDVVIWGGLEDETMLQPRLAAKKPVIRYSERLYKTGQWKAVSPRGLRKKYFDHTQYRKEAVYLLCAGAYVASDFHIVRAYPGKMFKWGYFPQCKEYDVDSLMEGKCRAEREANVGEAAPRTEILWAARFIDWKHPELVVALAECLAKERDDFHITMIGGGELKDATQALIQEKQLEGYITLAGTQTPSQVREAMEKAPIFLMTSDRQEGWGAVMNEAMNSGCAVIADRMEGAAPYLIEQGVNGFAYREAKPEVLAELIKPLLDSKEQCEQIGRKAYETITKLWNAGVAAERLLHICEDVAAGREPQIIWETGPCSKAEVIKERS
ncbi:MAG: glycosyltransferase [Lachnospiraceae bacterium]|nr:glycosyltransferase [Lachnospiraceae bacterium]MBQ7777038.1 glycosyltransferase [Lachnospiraceae bacterium]